MHHPKRVNKHAAGHGTSSPRTYRLMLLIYADKILILTARSKIRRKNSLGMVRSLIYSCKLFNMFIHEKWQLATRI